MHHLKRRTIPFTSIVGQEDMKFALILNAINPRIGGVLIRGDKGTAKSTAVRALADLLEGIAVVEACPFNCDPANPEEMCNLCFEKSETGRIKETSRKTPLIDLPLGATRGSCGRLFECREGHQGWHQSPGTGHPGGSQSRHTLHR